MTIQEQIEELLEQIQNQTGILFSITDSQIDEEEMLVTLKNMLRAGHNSTSKEGFLRGLLLGLLSEQEIHRKNPSFSSGRKRISLSSPSRNQTADFFHGAICFCAVLFFRRRYTHSDR